MNNLEDCLREGKALNKRNIIIRKAKGNSYHLVDTESNNIGENSNSNKLDGGDEESI